MPKADRRGGMDKAKPHTKPHTGLHALGLRPVPVEELKAAAGDIPCDVIGDAVKPGKVDQATRGAYLTAIEISTEC